MNDEKAFDLALIYAHSEVGQLGKAALARELLRGTDVEDRGEKLYEKQLKRSMSLANQAIEIVSKIEIKKP